MPRIRYYRKPLFNYAVFRADDTKLGDVLAGSIEDAMTKATVNYTEASYVKEAKLTNDPDHQLTYGETDPEVLAELKAKQSKPLKQ